MNRMGAIVSLVAGVAVLGIVGAAVGISFTTIAKNIGTSASATEFKNAIRDVLLANTGAVLGLFFLSYYFTATSQPSERMYLLVMTSLNLYVALNALGIGAMSQSQVAATIQ